MRLNKILDRLAELGLPCAEQAFIDTKVTPPFITFFKKENVIAADCAPYNVPRIVEINLIVELYVDINKDETELENQIERILTDYDKSKDLINDQNLKSTTYELNFTEKRKYDE